MPLSCPNANCHPEDFGCQDGYPTLGECPCFQQQHSLPEAETAATELADELTGRRANWTGSAMGLTDLEPLAARSRLLLIGLAGVENAGKTTFLALLYSLLRQGQAVPGYRFAGSHTLPGWELLAGFLTFRDSTNQVSFPPHTTRNAGRVPGLLHLALKDEDGHLLDVLFTDAPGEWFSEWRNSQLAEAAAGAEWIHQRGDGFLLFADCEELAGPNRGAARSQVQMVADRLLSNLGKRPLGLVWAKSDVENTRPAIRTSITEHIQRGGPQHYQEFAVSVKNEPQQWHAQVLETVAWLLDTLRHEPGTPLPAVARAESDDLFLLRRSVIV